MKKFEAVLLAIAIAVAAPVGTALLTLNNATFTDPWPWARALIIGCAVAVGALAYKWGQTHGPVITVTPRDTTEAEPAADYTTQNTTTVAGPMSRSEAMALQSTANPYVVTAVGTPLPPAPTLPDHNGTLPRPEAVSPPSASPGV